MYRNKLPKSLMPAVIFLLAGISFSNAKTITTTSQGGLWSDASTWIGSEVPTKNDDVVITSLVTTGNFYYSSGSHEMASLTVQSGGKIIREADKAGMCVLKIYGDLVNHGEIIDYRDWFDITLSGNLENHGTLKPRTLTLNGSNQQIKASMPIGSKTFYLNMSDEMLTATSDITFHNCAVNKTVAGLTKLLMGPHTLTLSADSITSDSYYNDVRSATITYVPIVFSGTGTLICDNAIIGQDITGSFHLQSPTYAFFRNMTVEGDLTISEGTKVSSESNLRNLTIKGDFINSGIINRDTVQASNRQLPPRSAYINIHGNAYNYGSTGISSIIQFTNGETVTLHGSYSGAVKVQQGEGTATPGGKVVISDEVTVSGKLEVYATLEITESGALRLLSTKFTNPYVRDEQGEIINNGSMSRYHYVDNSWLYGRTFDKQPGTFVDYELRGWDGRIDNVKIETFNGFAFPELPGSTHRWWRITSEGEGKVSYFTIKFYYDHELLNGQKEENLKVYRSLDEGESWEVVSARQDAVLDTVNNFISIGVWSKNESMLSDFGIFVISGGDGSVPVESAIKVDLVGRPDVRVGAPNPFTVHVWNVTDFPTNPVMLAMNITDDIRYKEVHFPYDGGVKIIPVDSISDPNELTQVFFIPYLEPNEHYTFDVIVYGVPGMLKSASADVPTITLGGFFGDKVKDTAVEYVVEEIGKAAELNDQEKDEYARGLGLTVSQLKSDKKQYGHTVSAFRDVSKHVVSKIAESNPVTNVLFKVGDAVESVSKIKDSLRRRLFHWLYKEVGLYGVEEKVASGKKIEGRLVASWDPNEIVGPAGYGPDNHVGEIPVMNYTIMFENLKDATAPAYRVQILDTLAAVFNPESVRFMETSHSGAGYTWKMERIGNVLKWDIEGIELLPNITPPEGEGFVRFSVELASGLPSGTVIDNRATIIFDMNPPIMTNTWRNILDFEAPVTTMDPVHYAAGDTVVQVSCTSADNKNGSGIGMYEFFASVDYGPFKSLGQSAENSISYQISDTTENNHRFYVLVTDNVGNAEKTIPGYAQLNSLLVNASVIDDISGGLKVYPNPASGILNILCLEAPHGNCLVELRTITGQAVYSRKLEGSELSGGIVLDTQAFLSGNYILRVIFENKVATQKITIRR